MLWETLRLECAQTYCMEEKAMVFSGYFVIMDIIKGNLPRKKTSGTTTILLLLENRLNIL